MSLLPPLVGELRIKASDVHVKFGEVIKESDKLAQKTTGNSEASGSAFDKLGRTSKVALGAMATGITGLIGTTGEMAGNFQEKMTLLATGAGVPKEAIAGISQGILDMAPKVQTSTGQLADGMYMIASAGYKGADGMNILQAAAEGAKVGGADLGTTADALTTVMTDYHLPAEKAAEVTSKLVATVANGKTHMQDLAGSMSHILPFSAGLGVSLNDTMGAMATMTGQGIQADEAATYLKFTMMALANETPKGAKALKEVGLSSKQVADDLKAKGLHGTLDEITESIGKKFPKGSAEYTAALADIVGGTRGMASALALTGDNSATYTEDIKKIGEATSEAGGHVEGFGETSQDLNNKMEGMRSKVEVLGIKIGTALIPALSAMADGATKAFDFLDQHKSILVAIAAIVGGVLAVTVAAWGIKFAETTKTVVESTAKMASSMAEGIGKGVGAFGKMIGALKETKLGQEAIAVATKAAAAAQWLFDAAMDANPIMLIVIAIAALVAGLIWAYNNLGWFKDFVNSVWSGIKAVFQVAIDWVVNTILPFFVNGWNAALSFVMTIWNNVASFISDALHNIGAVIQAVLNFIGSIWNAFWTGPIGRLVKAVFDLIVAVIRFAFEWISVGVKTYMAMINAAWTNGWNFIKSVATNVWNGIVAFVKVALQLVHDAIVVPIQNAWNFIVTAFTAVWNFYVSIWSAILGFVGAVLTNVYNAITGPVGQASNFVSDALHNIQSFFTDIWNNIVNAVGGFVSNIYNSITSKIGEVVNFFGGLGGKILGALGDLGGMLWNAGVNAVQGLINGIGSMIGHVADAIGGIVKTITDHLPHSPAKRGPLSGSGYTSVSGAKMIRDMAEGMLSESDTMATATAALMGLAPSYGGVQSVGSRPLVGSSGSQQGGQNGGTVIKNYYITMNNTTTADPNHIARELGYQISQMS